MGSVLYNLTVAPIEKIIDLVFMVIYHFTASPGIAILCVSLVINFAVLPLYKKADDVQEAERLKQKEMKPWIDHIKKAFKGDKRYMIQQTYYRQVGYNPVYAVRGSLSLLFQIPFFIAAYNYLSNLEILQNQSFLVIENLSEPDGLIKAGALTINLLPVLMTAFNIISSVVYTRGLPLKDKLQTYILALVFLVILYDSPSALVFYWTLNQVFSMLKNVFLKLIKRPVKVLTVVFCAAGVLITVYSVIKKSSLTSHQFLLFFAIGAACFVPIIIYAVSGKIKEKNIKLIALKAENKKAEKSVFYACSAALTVLLGAVVPLSVIKASPTEFITAVSGPFGIIINTLSVYAGFILIWINVFYLLGSERFRHIMTYLSAFVTVVFCSDFLFFGKKTGTLSALLKFDSMPSFGKTELLLNLAVSAVLFFAVLFVLKKKAAVFKNVSQIIAIALVISSLVNCFSVTGMLKKEGVYDKNQTVNADSKIIPLSKNGKNVVFIMLDRAISGFVPYLFNEKPELYDMFDGFTYYPNTVSFGLLTNFATPALFGGYEYTPTEINKRNNETLCEKQNEALRVLPALFGENGYSVTVVNPPYANYKWEGDVSIYDGMKNVSGYILNGLDLEDGNIGIEAATRTYDCQKHSFIYYSLMKTVPTVLHNSFYNLSAISYSKKNPGKTNTFLREYLTLKNLSDITEITGDGKNTFLMLQNSTTHEDLTLQEPEYDFSWDVTQYGTGKYTLNGKTVKTDSTVRLDHYQINMAALLTVGKWLDYLKEQGVYDNTRIIIAADHGRLLGQFEDFIVNDEMDVEGYNPLLLVKDFGAHGFKTSDEFMTNADVPSLSLSGVIENPVNPYTGKVINSSEKTAHPQIITTSDNFDVRKNNGNVFDTSDGAWWSVSKNIFEPVNWIKQEN